MNRLIDCIKEYETIAVCGMCKNAGKTTVVNHIISEFHTEFKTGLTSIGYDGEETDEITLLKKPRINVFPGMVVATCESCLEKSTTPYKILERTGMKTVLGEILVIEATDTGIMEVSGPSSVSQIIDICMIFRKAGCEKIMVDGSAGRLSFAAGLDCMVLSVGAALSNNMNTVVRLAEHQERLLRLSECDGPLYEAGTEAPYIIRGSGAFLTFDFRGPVVDEDIDDILKNHRGVEKRIAANDPSALFVSPQLYKKFLNRNGHVCVRNTINLVAVTINPMSPYGEWFDKGRFLHEMQSRIETPVFNVLDKEE